MPLSYFIALSATLLCIGIYGVLARRNAILVLLSVEIMLNSVNINLIAFSRYITPDTIVGQIYTIFAMAAGAAEIGIGLAVVLLIYRGRETVNVDEVNMLKW
ncbi:MAG: NADH-quinone oxidoreductase subunit NuoK [Actinomycetota bacterium]